MNEKQCLMLLHGRPIRDYSIQEYLFLKKFCGAVYSWLTKSGNPISYLCKGARTLQMFKLACATSVNGTPSPESPKDLLGFNGAWRYHNTFTFDGVTYALPPEYTLLEYAELDGSSYFDTSIIPANKKIGMVLDFQLTSFASNDQISGSYHSDGVDNFQWSEYTNGGSVKWRWKLGSAGGYGADCDTNRHTVYFNTDVGTKLDTTIIASTQYTIPSTNTNSIWLGARNSNEESPCCAKFYSAKYYDYTSGSAVALAYLVFVKNSSGVIGAYDFISGTFLANQGTGTLVAGNEIAKGLHQWGRTENLWDKSLSTTGWVNGSGTIVDYPNGQAQMSDYVECDAGDQFLICGFYNGSIYTYGQKEIAWFNSSKTFLSRDSDTSSATSFTATAPTNAKYCKFGVYNSSDTTVITHDAVAIKGSTAPSSYIPYYSYNGNKGKAYVNNNVVCSNFPDIVNGNIDLISGSGSDEWGVKVFDGTESWDTYSVTNCYSYRPSDIVDTSYTDRTILCNYYQQTATLPETSERQGYCFKGHNGGSSYIAFGSTVAYTTVALWNAHLKELYDAGNPVMAIYKKATASAITCTAVSVAQTDGTNTAEARNCNDVVSGTLSVTYYGEEA